MGFSFVKNANIVASLAKSLEKTTVTLTDVRHVDYFYGGPVIDSLALQYLLCSNVFLLSTVYQLFGPPKVGKSTIALDWLRRFFLDIGAAGLHIDTENKISADLIRALARSSDMPIARTSSQQDAQQILTEVVTLLRKNTLGDKADTEHPSMQGVTFDSFRVSSKAAIAAVQEDGHAGKRFAEEALLWRQYLSAMSDMMRELPISIIFVNHQVEKMAQAGGGAGPSIDVGGGQALKFLQTYQIQVTKALGSKDTKSSSYSVIRLRTTENSNGPRGRAIFPRIVYATDAEDAEYNGIYVDWKYADAQMLTGNDIPRSVLKQEGICNATLASDKERINDDVLGLKCVTINEYLEQLNSDASRIKRLQDILNIHRYKNLDELWEQGWFYKDTKKRVFDTMLKGFKSDIDEVQNIVAKRGRRPKSIVAQLSEELKAENVAEPEESTNTESDPV